MGKQLVIQWECLQSYGQSKKFDVNLVKILQPFWMVLMIMILPLITKRENTLMILTKHLQFWMR